MYDPWADCDRVKHEYNLDCINTLPSNVTYDAVILSVSHNEFLNLDIKAMLKETGVLFDVKGVLDVSVVDGRL
ncbi:UDP binding domain-containing protein [Mucilaginibacter humi]|uniref:UDP binding domain-containing protein n=1 Tax=Mucilaginibacter humi TaxID=2732510 RepID=UPI00293C06E9|nr:UDP binding domain-containing protein [Mucilaginibacter humi]